MTYYLSIISVGEYPTGIVIFFKARNRKTIYFKLTLLKNRSALTDTQNYIFTAKKEGERYIILAYKRTRNNGRKITLKCMHVSKLDSCSLFGELVI